MTNETTTEEQPMTEKQQSDALGEQTQPVDDQTIEPEADATDEGGQDEGKPGREASRYRRQLRAAEAERDGLKTTLDEFRTEVFDGLVGARLDPRLARAAGFGPDSLFGEDGHFDLTAVDTIVADTRKEFGRSLNPHKRDPALGKGGTYDNPGDPADAFNIAAMLKGAR